MRITVLAAGSFTFDERLPHRMIADVTVDGTRHTVEYEHDYWSCTCEDGDCAHIAAVRPLAGQEQDAPVADGPVTLPVGDARELTHLGVGHGFDGWTVVANEEHGHGRWESHHRLIIRDADGRHFAADYSQGLTEYQDTQPWEGQKTVTFHPVVPRSRVAVAVEWVAPEQGGES